MARDVDDVALFLDAMVGVDEREPMSLETPAHSFRASAAERVAPTRVAYSADLGIIPVDPEVAEITAVATRRFSEAGSVVEETHPDFSGAHEAFHVLRAQEFAVGLSDALAKHSELLKPEVVWNVEVGLALTADQIADAIKLRGTLTACVMAFMRDWDVLATPATIMPAFSADRRYPETCAGQSFETYVDWLMIASAITLTGLPAISIPCGFTNDGLPVGLQLVGRPRGEAALISAAGVLQDILNLPSGPIDPRSPGGT